MGRDNVKLRFTFSLWISDQSCTEVRTELSQPVCHPLLSIS